MYIPLWTEAALGGLGILFVHDLIKMVTIDVPKKLFVDNIADRIDEKYVDPAIEQARSLIKNPMVWLKVDEDAIKGASIQDSINHAIDSYKGAIADEALTIAKGMALEAYDQKIVDSKKQELTGG